MDHQFPLHLKQEKINGIADQFIIYPNKSIEMVGKAQLINGGRSINSELITYQINSND